MVSPFLDLVLVVLPAPVVHHHLHLDDDHRVHLQVVEGSPVVGPVVRTPT